MFYVANGYLHNHEDAEDAVHQAFVRIAKCIQSIDDSSPEKLKGLVTTITTRCAIDLLRKRDRYEQHKNEVVPHYDAGIETKSALGDSLAKLPDKYRDIILLKCCYGYEMDQIAKLLNITEASAYKTFSRAKKKFEQICIEDGLL
jgi:RNA polymerase sigma-70 factor (ECF subfamily)